MKRIVWLAAYPKSGTTWFRVFLANFLRNADRPVSINSLDGAMASERGLLHQALGFDTGELSFDEVDRLRPEVYRHLAATATGPRFLKAHDAYTFLPDGQPLFPPEATAGVLYFIRNPLDVCVSFAHHGGHADYERTIRRMADRQSCADGGIGGQVRMIYSSWSEHVTGWTHAAEQRVHVVRYEDLKRRPEETFTAALRFAGLPVEPERIARAIAFSRFEEVQRQEKADGFGEKQRAASSFFRRGEIGSWREALTPAQVARLVAAQGETMQRFGYLSADGTPVF